MKIYLKIAVGSFLIGGGFWLVGSENYLLGIPIVLVGIVLSYFFNGKPEPMIFGGFSRSEIPFYSGGYNLHEEDIPNKFLIKLYFTSLKRIFSKIF
ncbi:MAG: hypothetical protein DWQ06_15860 [Calditrichaeota bacterium]|nr:MAG: hypothetical protein DWQ06_15860 [Calditrichota bacterium]